MNLRTVIIYWSAVSLALMAFGLPRDFAAEAPAVAPQLQVATSEWIAAESPVYCDPDDDWAKDPSVIKAGDTYYMYYTSANPWQDSGQGAKGRAG